VAAALGTVAKPALQRHGFATQDVVLRWPAIVGRHLAGRTAPERLAFPRGRASEGVLHLRVEAAVAPEVQHLAPLIVEKVNMFFGYAAVVRLALHQGPLPRAATAAAPAPAATPAVRAEAARLAGAAADAGLREALARLGEAVLSGPPPRRQ